MQNDLAVRLQKMAQFGYALVHECARVDNERVYASIQTDLGDLDTFCQQIVQWLG